MDPNLQREREEYDRLVAESNRMRALWGVVAGRLREAEEELARWPGRDGSRTEIAAWLSTECNLPGSPEAIADHAMNLLADREQRAALLVRLRQLEGFVKHRLDTVDGMLEHRCAEVSVKLGGFRSNLAQFSHLLRIHNSARELGRHNPVELRRAASLRQDLEYLHAQLVGTYAAIAARFPPLLEERDQVPPLPAEEPDALRRAS